MNHIVYMHIYISTHFLPLCISVEFIFILIHNEITETFWSFASKIINKFCTQLQSIANGFRERLHSICLKPNCLCVVP